MPLALSVGVFSLFSFGEVSKNDGIVFLPLHSDMRNGGFDRKLFSVGAESHDGSQFAHLSAGHAALPERLNMMTMGRTEPCGQESIERLSDCFFSGTAEHLLCCSVEQHDSLILIHRDDRIHRGFDDAFQPELADQELLFRLLTGDCRPCCIELRSGLLRFHRQSSISGKKRSWTKTALLLDWKRYGEAHTARLLIDLMARRQLSLFGMKPAFDLGEFTIQGLTVDAKGMGGLIFIATGLFENFLDVLFFKLVQGQSVLGCFVQYTPVATGPLHRRG